MTRRCAGYTVLELTVAVAVFSLLFFAAATTISKAVQTASDSMRETEALVQGRRTLEEVESLLSGAGRSSLECIPYSESFGTFDEALTSLDQFMGAEFSSYRIPIEGDYSDVFFQNAVVSADGNTAYEPEFGYYCVYMRPMRSMPGRYELVYFDGTNKKVLGRNFEDVHFEYEDGMLDVTVDMIVDENKDGSFEVVKLDRLVLIRMS